MDDADTYRRDIRDAAKDLTRREALAVALIGLMDDLGPLDAMKAFARGKDAEHAGDCTKMPWTCWRCYRDDALHNADDLLDRMRVIGVTVWNA